MDAKLQADSKELLVQVRKMRVGYTRFLTDALAAVHLNIPQYTALAVLGEKGEVTMGALAEGLGISMGAVTSMVDRLIDAGLAERDRGTDDRRVVRVKLTDNGTATLDKAATIGANYFARYLAELGDEERKTFIATYRKLADRVIKDFAESRAQ